MSIARRKQEKVDGEGGKKGNQLYIKEDFKLTTELSFLYLRKTVLSPPCCSQKGGHGAGQARPLPFLDSLDQCAS